VERVSIAMKMAQLHDLVVVGRTFLEGRLVIRFPVRFPSVASLTRHGPASTYRQARPINQAIKAIMADFLRWGQEKGYAQDRSEISQSGTLDRG
jgi:hypothetical protein